MTNLFRNQRSTQRVSLGAASLALLTVIITACNEPRTQTSDQPQVVEPVTEQQEQQEQVAEAEQPEVTTENADIEDIAENPEAFAGQEQFWSVRGQVIERLDGNFVRMRGDSLFAGEEILAVLPEEFIFPNENGVSEKIQVTGEVRQFTAAEAEQLNLAIPPDEYAEYEGTPLIVAKTAGLSPTLSELTSNPDVFYTNQPIALEGSLEELAPNTYRFTEGGLGSGEVLVLNAQPPQNAEALDNVVVTGIPQRFNLADLQSEYNWEPELQEQLSEDYADKPVIRATGVYPIEE